MAVAGVLLHPPLLSSPQSVLTSPVTISPAQHCSITPWPGYHWSLLHSAPAGSQPRSPASKMCSHPVEITGSVLKLRCWCRKETPSSSLSQKLSGQIRSFFLFTNFFIVEDKTGERRKLCWSLSLVSVEYLEKYLSISKNGADLMTSPAYAATPSRILLTTNIFRQQSPSQYILW